MNLEKWKKLSFAEEMGNIGSEISRARHWEEANDLESRNKAIERAIELIDLAIADTRQGSRLMEILRLREVFCDLFLGKKIYNVSPKSLEKYFLPLALLARKN